MKTLEHATTIAASPDTVWAIVMDVDHYPEWNPFLQLQPAPSGVGEPLSVTIRPGKRRMTFHPTVTSFEPGRQISWLGRVLIPGLFDGEHTLLVQGLPDGSTRFAQRETFRGVLVALMPGVIRDTDRGFKAMNAALRDRAESRHEAAPT